MAEAGAGGLRITRDLIRGCCVAVKVDQRSITAFSGETVATALLAAGIRCFRRSVIQGAPRGPFCLMGVCQECLVTIDGRQVLGCQVRVRDGLEIETGTGR